MENASKALIIAGSVLIAILLISLGIAVFNSTSGVTTQAEDLGETLEISTYNSQFNKYFGTVKGNQVRDLCEIVSIHNSNNPSKQITIGGHTDSNDITNYAYNTISTIKSYEVLSTGKDGNGRITSISVTEK